MNALEFLYLVLNELEICASQLTPDEDRTELIEQARAFLDAATERTTTK